MQDKKKDIKKIPMHEKCAKEGKCLMNEMLKEMSYDEYKKLSPEDKDKHNKKEAGIEDE